MMLFIFFSIIFSHLLNETDNNTNILKPISLLSPKYNYTSKKSNIQKKLNPKMLINDGILGEAIRYFAYDSNIDITGSGEMYNYSIYNSPLYNLRKTVKNINIKDKITSIGRYVFYGFEMETICYLKVSKK